MSESQTCMGSEDLPEAQRLSRCFGAFVGLLGCGYGTFALAASLPGSTPFGTCIVVTACANIGRTLGIHAGEGAYHGFLRTSQFFEENRLKSQIEEEKKDEQSEYREPNNGPIPMSMEYK